VTERSFGKSQNTWYGIVTSVKDPDMDGRVQVRVHGQHDDQTNIPDTDLPWAKPEQDITHAAHNKIGRSPTGIIVGAVISGYYLDTDMQVLVYTATVAKAGDPQSNGTTTNGQTQLQPGTNSSPLGGRIANNAFITRKGKNIVTDDTTGSKGPTEQKDTDGVDVVAQAKAALKFGTFPTVGSIAGPVGSILQQITQIDPKNLNAVLPQALQAYIKIKDLNAASSTVGINGILGQLMGAAMQLTSGGPAVALNQLGSTLQPGQLSNTAQSALLTAVQQLGANTPITTLSATVQSIIGQSLPAFVAALEALIQANQLNSTSLNALMEQFFSQVQQNAQQATVGANQGNILSNMTSLIPQIAGAIQSTLSGHLPQSVLNTNLITQALQRFAMNQAFLKAPSNGKKELAIQATSNPIIDAPTTNILGVSNESTANILGTLTNTGTGEAVTGLVSVNIASSSGGIGHQ
jgi:hypothetical protein